MSTSSVRRIKECGGGGGRIAAQEPSKNLAPVSGNVSGRGTLKKSNGNGNPRPTSRGRSPAAAAVSQKPATEAMRRIERRGGGSSVPRGRSSSPSEFNKVLSDLANGRASRVPVGRSASTGRKSVAGVSVSERVQQKTGTLKEMSVKSSEGSLNGTRVLTGYNNSVNTDVGSGKIRKISKKYESDLKARQEARLGISGGLRGDANLNSASSITSLGRGNFKVKASNSFRVCEELKERSCVESESYIFKRSTNSMDLGGNRLGRKAMSASRGPEKLKQKDFVEEHAGGGTINKYPSKLHEKLAFLEEKVKRIASDIKRTKEMLEMDASDASKMIISDINKTNSGIEKEAGHAINGAEGMMVVTKATENSDMQSKTSDRSPNKDVEDTEELEAMLFPHHKLLRDRTSSQVSLARSEMDQADLVQSSSELKGEKLSSLTNEVPILSELLPSMNKDRSRFTTMHENVASTSSRVQETKSNVTSAAQDSSNIANEGVDAEVIHTADETHEFDVQEKRQGMINEGNTRNASVYQLNEIGRKISTAGWFVSEGEAVLLAHDDGSCSYYDIVNCEEKAEYKPPVEVSPNIWRDCWIIRAPGADGCSEKHVVAASAGNTLDSGFCSWDFYTRDVRAFHIEDGTTNPRTSPDPLCDNTTYSEKTPSIDVTENQEWWYEPCGPLIISTASWQRAIGIHDIRDGEQIMKWEVQNPVLAMDYSSPLQWRNSGKVVVAEEGNISVWDVNSINSRALVSVSLSDQKVSALHVNNTDAEVGGGIRQRVRSSEAEGNDGVFCTADYVNVLDFRHPRGVGLMMPILGVNVQSVYSRGESIFLGCTKKTSAGRNQLSSQVQQYSLRKWGFFTSYSLPESNAGDAHHAPLTQVWGNPNFVMGVCGRGLFAFDALKDHEWLPFSSDHANLHKLRKIIGPDDLYSPSFDYLASRVLLISRDRPASWRYLS
ncbi:KIN14B-interacting protein At4g14310-like [Diospyros lotus]|uniref:KIN14B-interacting protein At4g14310-like n=1 Tax=Diospyros lotus TaxID=55363 RepID=UPI00225505C7|nr:KIN14B-interacting protein At4g14310-like [Diospyros lotus]